MPFISIKVMAVDNLRKGLTLVEEKTQKFSGASSLLSRRTSSNQSRADQEDSHYNQQVSAPPVLPAYPFTDSASTAADPAKFQAAMNAITHRVVEREEVKQFHPAHIATADQRLADSIHSAAAVCPDPHTKHDLTVSAQQYKATKNPNIKDAIIQRVVSTGVTHGVITLAGFAIAGGSAAGIAALATPVQTQDAYGNSTSGYETHTDTVNHHYTDANGDSTVDTVQDFDPVTKLAVGDARPAGTSDLFGGLWESLSDRITDFLP